VSEEGLTLCLMRKK